MREWWRRHGNAVLYFVFLALLFASVMVMLR